jgi:SAM-dependent methyltransferase
MISESITNCRLCGETELDVILDLGDQPPANSLRTDPKVRLEAVPLVICRCPRCTTVQLTETVSPQHLFRDYLWVTGTSQTAREYSERFYENIVKRSATKPLFVVEVASNDGTFLQQFKRHGHRVLGVDPALNLARVAEAVGVPTLADFFGLKIGDKLVKEYGHADAVFARNVLPHVPDPNDVVAGIAHCLSETGVGAIEFHWADKIVSELHYDSIYHEHFFYHSLHSINAMLTRHELLLFDVTESPISGGSLVAYFAKKPRPKTLALQEKLAYESERGLATLKVWQDFGAKSTDHSRRLRGMLDAEIASGRRVIGYGASARSSTLLNFCGIDHTYLNCIADQSPLKHGRYTPGTNILILSPEDALARKPDTVLLLGWNFRDEILGRMKQLGFVGRVIVPLPGMPEVIEV